MMNNNSNEGIQVTTKGDQIVAQLKDPVNKMLTNSSQNTVNFGGYFENPHYLTNKNLLWVLLGNFWEVLGNFESK